MKGNRYATEDKIRILREADRGERAFRTSAGTKTSRVVSFQRWKKQFGHMEINEARRLKELERENRELKQMFWRSYNERPPRCANSHVTW